MKLTALTARTAIVHLLPLEATHREALRSAASADAIWAHWPRDVVGDGWNATFDWQLAEQTAGRWLLHTVFTPDGKAVGQTCYLSMRPEHSGVEIGGTWYAPAAQGTMINPACKLLMLTHAFSSGAERVELKTDAANLRSRAAILKLGAQFEGIFRHHMRRPDGTWRSTAWYSILSEDWPRVQAGLTERLGHSL
jgi:N-acetyltransferase